MKLGTDIKPSGDGTVTAEFGAVQYVFSGDQLECDVSDDDHVTHLLGTGNFYPLDEKDFKAAEEKLQVNNEDHDGDDDEDDDEGSAEGPPLEALTAPVKSNKPPRKAK